MTAPSTTAPSTTAAQDANQHSFTKSYFIELAEYINWADHSAINWLMQISDEQWEQAATSSFSSIKQTAMHMVSAKRIWLDFWTDTPNPVYLSAAFKGSKTDLIDLWKMASADLTYFINHYALEHYTKLITIKMPNGALNAMEFWKTFPHMVNHSTYHRGQLVTLLRQAGFSNFSNTDLFTFYSIAR